MVNLEILNDAELLLNCRCRFEKSLIFTYVGPTLLVTNPFQNVPPLYTKEVLQSYQSQAINPSFQLKDLPPHVYALAALTYKQLFENQKKQVNFFYLYNKKDNINLI